jgi:hypothetical protein
MDYTCDLTPEIYSADVAIASSTAGERAGHPGAKRPVDKESLT